MGKQKEDQSGLKEMKKDRWIVKVSPGLTAPSLKDNRGDVDRLLGGLRKALDGGDVSIDFGLYKRIPSTLREYGYEVQAVLYRGPHAWHLVGLFPSGMDDPIYGLAVDLGTSTVVVQLLDLIKGEIKDETSFHNPQMEFGQDILARVHFASEKGGLEKLQKLLIDRLNEEISHLTQKDTTKTISLVGMCVSGNTVMTHLL
jgi:uncharacterized 2Fe-2S/4Fe-4S cluster protein (DUF4445 family)